MRGGLQPYATGSLLLAALVCGCRAPQPSTSELLSTAVRSNPVKESPDGVVQAGYEGTSIGDPPPGRSVSEADDDDRLALADFAPTSIRDNFLVAIGQGPDEAIAEQAWQEAEAHFAAGRYDEAASSYRTAARRWPDSLLEEDALFMAAESYFFANEYPKTIGSYQKLLKKYENSRHLDMITARMFAIGRYYDEEGKQHSRLALNALDETRPWFDTTGNAVSVYNKIRLHDPTGPLADDSTMAAANNYFLRDYFDESARLYDVVRKEYPQSDYQPQAHMLAMRSRLEMYEGPSYDGTALLEAEEICQQTMRQFGRDMAEEQPRLMQTATAIHAQRAERDWMQGEYYRKLGYNRAARYYYEAVLRDYGDTRFAEMARTQIEAIKHLPPEPHDYFAWMKKVFGERRR